MTVKLVVPPAVAILGTGRAREDVLAVDGKVAIHPRMPLSLTFDHRVVTGGEAVRFLGALVRFLDALAFRVLVLATDLAEPRGELFL